MDKFKEYYQFLISENKKYNLTSITNQDEVYIKHFEDSLAIAKFVDLEQIKEVVDIGSGAGFPGIPLKINYPHLKLTIIEPNQKKCRFLEKLLVKLQLKDVIIINERAEALFTLRESFDLGLARAVGSISMLCELCLPLVKVGSLFIAMKGPDYLEDLEKAENAFKVLDAKVDKIEEYQLSQNMGKRSLIKIKKLKVTNKTYPRSFAIIKKKPL